jgi:hypothetical protein
MPFCKFSRKHGAPPKSQQQWGAKQVCEHLNRDACNKQALQHTEQEKAVLFGQTRCHRVAKLGATGFVQAALSKALHHPYKITLTCNLVLIGMRRFNTHFNTHNKGSQVQLKLKRIYYMGLLHPTAKTGATDSGNTVPPSLPARRDTDIHQNRCHRDQETGPTGFVQTERKASFQSTNSLPLCH